MKKLRITTALMALCLLTGCSSEDSSSIETMRKFPLDHVEVAIPSSYEVCYPEPEESAPYEEYYIYNDTDGISNIFVTAEKNEQNLSAYYSYVATQYAALDGYTLYTRNDELIGDYDAVISEFGYTAVYDNNDKKVFRCYAAYVQKKSMVYVITCIAPQENYDERREEFASVCSSIILRD